MTGRVVGGGWRLLGDADVIERTDQTCTMSTLLAGWDDWQPMDEPHPAYGDEWASAIGRSVADYVANDSDMDRMERAFRRRTER